MTRVVLDERSLSLLKSHAARQLPGVKYGHALEVIARGLGFNTWSALTAHRKGVANDLPTARAIDTEEMRRRLVKLGYVQEAGGPLSFTALEDDLHFLCDIDGIAADRMAKFRLFLNMDHLEHDPATAIARMAWLDLTSQGTDPRGRLRIPVLDVLRDYGIVGQYDDEFVQADVDRLMKELIHIRIDLSDGTKRWSFSAVNQLLNPISEPDLLYYTLSVGFFDLAKAALLP